MSLKKIRPQYRDEWYGGSRYPSWGLLTRLPYHQARQVVKMRAKYYREVNDPALRPKPYHKPYKRREKRGQGKPR
jgi:hypothetical protein